MVMRVDEGGFVTKPKVLYSRRCPLVFLFVLRVIYAFQQAIYVFRHRAFCCFDENLSLMLNVAPKDQDTDEAQIFPFHSDK